MSIPHYAVIANTVQMAAYYRVSDDMWWRGDKEKRKKRIGPGDVAIAVLPFYRTSPFII